VFWVISVYFNIRNTLLKSGTFLLGHPVYLSGKMSSFLNSYLFKKRARHCIIRILILLSNNART
jgi:cobalamin biosynthesis protein CobD/CbiB